MLVAAAAAAVKAEAVMEMRPIQAPL